MTIQKVLEDIRNRVFSPVYFLTGEEPFFIDQISEAIADTVLDDSEKEFNQSVIYGNDVTVSAILDMARRFPMFAPYQVIIIKEAQDLREIENIGPYVDKPVPTTILVFCYKYKKLDKRKGFVKALQNKAVFFEAKKLYDNQVADWVVAFTKSKGYHLEPKAAMVLTEQIGADISRMATEIQKLMINIPPGSSITVDHIERFIGISKEFNVFELQKAIGDRNVFKANHIAFYMAANPKENPIQKLVPILYSFFVKVLLYHHLPDKKGASVASALGISPYFVTDYQRAAQTYSAPKIESIISVLREYDLRSKGVNNDSTDNNELIREMLYKILH
ncbi:MAG: DNA polymerase III subunit delta [Bacteroidales bacterium]